MQRVAEANRLLQQERDSRDRTEDGAAPIQHTEEAGRDESDAK